MFLMLLSLMVTSAPRASDSTYYFSLHDLVNHEQVDEA